MPTKPQQGTRKADKFKDGLKKGGGAEAQRHAGPGRSGRTLSGKRKAQP